MLIISVTHNWSDQALQTHYWEVGKPFPVYSAQAIASVQEVFADGHELEYIQAQFNNIPLSTRYVEHSWYGDTAKFIVGCLSRIVIMDHGKTADAV